MRRRAASNEPPVQFENVVPPIFSPSLQAELAQHEGRWVAVDDAAQRVIAVGDTVGEVVARARSMQVHDPLVLRVPAHPELPRLL